LTLFKKILGYMGFNAKNVETPPGQNVPGGASSTTDNQLSKQEIEVLLNLIKNSTFNGSVLELLYTLVVKLQKQYKNLP